MAVVAPAIAQEEDGDDEDEPGAQIRLVHGVADGPAVDVYINGDRVLQEVDAGEVIQYQEVEPGNHTIVMVAAEDPGGVVLETEFEAEERGNYTVAATGQFDEGEGQVEPVVLLDNATQPPDELAAVRLGHMVSGAPDVTVTLNETGDVVFDSVSFGDSSAYRTIPAGDYTFDIRAEGEDGEILRTVDADLTGGQATSLLAIGAEEENETLQVIQQTDPIGPDELSPDIVPEPDGDAVSDDTDDETEDAETDGEDATDDEGATEEDADEAEDTADEEDADEEDATDDEDTQEEDTADEEDADEEDEAGNETTPDIDIGGDGDEPENETVDDGDGADGGILG